MSTTAETSLGEEIVSFIKTLAFLFVLAVIIRGSFLEPFKIPSGSMLPTLQIGDHILVSKLSYGFRIPFMSETLYRYGAPERGEVVVFTRLDDPITEKDESADNIIKRVVGLPGDLLEVRGTKVYVNEIPLEEPYARWIGPTFGVGDFGPTPIPQDTVLVLGDNRNHSRDSRFWHDPFLPLDRIKGRALLVYWSWADLGRIATLIR